MFPVPRSDVEGTVSDGVATGVSSGSGVGVGLVFFRFDLLFGVSVGEGVGEAFFRLGEAVGDGVAVGFCAECFRCLRGGVGSGANTFLIFEPNDSSAANETCTAPNKIAKIRSRFITRSVVSAFLSGDSSSIVRPDAPRKAHATERGRRRTGVPQAPQTPAFAKASAWQEISVLLVREFLEDGFVKTNSAFEIFERKIFVR